MTPTSCNIYIYTHTHTHIYIYIYICIYACKYPADCFRQRTYIGQGLVNEVLDET